MDEICSSSQAFDLLKTKNNSYAEELWIISLNSQMQIIGFEMIFRGTVDHCLIHPRDILRFLVSTNACSFIMAHNHPSNDPTPSDQDFILTRKIHKLSQLIQIPLHDHLIFTATQYFSMADHGLIKLNRRSRILKSSGKD